jgi:CYTH domain-containing protein
MGKEIERKFLVDGDDWRSLGQPVRYRQGYLSTVKERTVRVRTIADKGYLTVKGVSTGISRAEFEYEIPVEDANAMLDALCERPLIEKNRHKIPFGKHTWEVDEFFGDNEGLILAEVELEDENETFESPSWIGQEVSDDARYFNANLIANPFCSWGE